MWLHNALFVGCLLTVAAVTAAAADEEKPAAGPANEVHHPSGLIVKTIKESKNCHKKAEIGDHLTVHYVGRLDNEHGKIFDQSRKNNRPFNFQLGANQVIQG